MRGVDAVKFLAQGGNVLDQFVIFGRIIIGSLGQLLVQTFNLFLHLEKVGECLCRFIENGSFVVGH